MTITGIITAIVIGAVIGALARLILPGRQNIPIWLTIVVGIVAAVIGTFLARAIGISTATSGVDWLELLVQLVVGRSLRCLSHVAPFLCGFVPGQNARATWCAGLIARAALRCRRYA